jgi:hypothetical protein
MNGIRQFGRLPIFVAEPLEYKEYKLFAATVIA